MTSDLSVSWCNECDLSARGPHLATLSVSAVGLPAPVSVRGCPAAASDWAGRLRYRSYLDSYRANGRSLRPRYNRFAVLHDRLSACLSAASLSLCLSVSVCLSPCPAPPRHTHTHTHTHTDTDSHTALSYVCPLQAGPADRALVRTAGPWRGPRGVCPAGCRLSSALGGGASDRLGGRRCLLSVSALGGSAAVPVYIHSYLASGGSLYRLAGAEVFG